jgi:hypothetical protein
MRRPGFRKSRFSTGLEDQRLVVLRFRDVIRASSHILDPETASAVAMMDRYFIGFSIMGEDLQRSVPALNQESFTVALNNRPGSTLIRSIV